MIFHDFVHRGKFHGYFYKVCCIHPTTEHSSSRTPRMVTIEEMNSSSPMKAMTKPYLVTTPDDEPPTAEISKMRLLSEVCLHFLSKEENIRASQRLTLREAVHEATSSIDSPFTTEEVLAAVCENNYYDFTRCKTPKASVSSVLSQDARYVRVDYSTYEIKPEFRNKQKRKLKDTKLIEPGSVKLLKKSNNDMVKCVEFPPKRKHVAEFKQEKTQYKHAKISTNFPQLLPKAPQIPVYLAYTNALNQYLIPYQTPTYGIYGGSYF